MKRIIYTFFWGMLCTLSSLAQPFDIVLNTAQTGNVTNQARNSITMAAGYSYTPNGGSMLSEIVNPVVIGTISPSPAINPSSYSINTALAVGKTQGAFKVNGMSNYTLALDVPKGTAGLQPSINLSYLSNYNDGLLGLGWNIGGLSSISRVGQNLYFETQAQPIKGDLTDKYTLDGKRLIMTSSGNYGVDGSVYSTEIEEFSKITAIGATGQGPAHFEVRTKSGLICEYGNTSDSKVLRDGSCVLTWKINKITDRYGNCINFTYFNSDDERPIMQIDYGTSTNLFASIYFRYKQRTDISTYIYGGREFTRDLLLDNIEMKNNNQSFKKYQMDYCQVGAHAQLLKVTEYSSQNQPLNPTVFVYSQQTEQLTTNTSFYSSSTAERVFHGDFNGDGRMDMVTISSNVWKLYMADSSDNMVFKTQRDLRSGFCNLLLGDFDGDGRCDLIQIYLDNYDYNRSHADYNFEYTRSRGDGTFDADVQWIMNDILINYEYNNQRIVDYNGDGKFDIMVHDKRNYKIYSATGTLLVSGRVDFDLIKEEGKFQNRGIEINDLNNDGCSDILAIYSTDYVVYEFKGEGGKLIKTYPSDEQQTNYFSAGSKIELADLENDGNTDIIRKFGNILDKISIINGGISIHDITGLPTFNFDAQNNRWTIADMNGDGFKDIVIYGKGTSTSNSANRINVAYNKGNGYDYNVTEYNTSPITFDMAFDADSTNYFNFADYDGDGRDEFFYSKPGDQCCFSFISGTSSNLLSKIIDGFGAKTEILYVPMTYAPVYTRGTGAVYPLSDFSSGMPLVYAVAYDNGIGSTTAIHYNYQGAKIHLKGKGFLGFSKVTVTNTNTGISTENNYVFDSPYYYPKLMTSCTRQENTTISTLANTWGTEYNYGNSRIFPYVSSSTQTDALKNLSVTRSVSYPVSNLYGNVSSVTVSYSPGPTETTVFGYGDENVAAWLIGRPTSMTKTSTNGSDSQTYALSRTWMATSNNPDIEQYNTGDASSWTLDRDYDSFGNLSKESRSATGLTTTYKSYNYDTAHGVNLLSVYESQGGTGTTTYTWYPATGLLNTQTDPYGNTATYSYNTSDQLSSVAPSTGISTTIGSSFIVTGGPSNTRYYIDKTGNDGSEVKTWYDVLGRELRTETRKYGGSLVKVDKQYNAKGELAQYSEPTTGTPSSWNIVGHDDDGRVTQIDPIFGPTTVYSYSGGTTTRTVNSRQYSNTQNAAGWITSTVDPGGTITNGYWPNGLPKSVTTPQGYITSMTYDKNGNRLSITDPSSGNSSNAWYGTGQLKSSTNADGQTTTCTYTADPKVQLQNLASPEGQTSYTYYTNGLVNTITSPNNVTRAYTYELGKVKTVTESVDGLTNVVTYEYDSKGRLYRKYFNGTTEYEQYDYDTNSGYLYRIQFTAAGNTSTVWQLSNMDDYNRATQASIGSTTASWTYDSGSNLLSGISVPGVQGYSYSFDANTGNLTSRTNSLRTKTDTFGYDTEKLDRLTSVTGSASPTVSVTYTTDKSGNIQTKSDAGTYVYDATQPYAVDQITNGLNIATASQTITYYSFEKVKDITEGTKKAEFIYNADQQRIRMVLKTSETTTRTKYYFGGSCEREVAGGVTTQYIWIGGDAYTAVAVAKKVGTGSWTVSNIFRDHLGTITHLKGSTTDEYNFDAWGRRRDKDDWTYTLTSEPTLFADRGFTGHEYLEDFKLYNMNGRLYDPVVGRFLSPDPVVQDPSFTQSLNRYSYCLNNPLKFTDPTGNKWNWNWLNPLYWFSEGMQTINDNTKQLRQNMAKAGIPSFSIGTSVGFSGDINFNASYRDQEVFNTANVDKSNADIKVEKEIARVNGLSNGENTPWYSIYNWPALGSSARTMDAIYAGNYLSATGHFLTCAAEVFTLGYASEISLGSKTVGSVIKSGLGDLKIPIYRVYGEGASMYGKSYSLINPKYVPFYRNFAGLPEVNSGQYLLKGSIPLRDINVGRWFAAPLDGNTGGLPFELYQSFDQLINPVNVIIKKPF